MGVVESLLLFVGVLIVNWWVCDIVLVRVALRCELWYLFSFFFYKKKEIQHHYGIGLHIG